MENYNILTNTEKEKFILENGWYRTQFNRNFFTNDELNKKDICCDETRAYIYILEEKLNLKHI